MIAVAAVHDARTMSGWGVARITYLDLSDAVRDVDGGCYRPPCVLFEHLRPIRMMFVSVSMSLHHGAAAVERYRHLEGMLPG